MAWMAKKALETFNMSKVNLKSVCGQYLIFISCLSSLSYRIASFIYFVPSQFHAKTNIYQLNAEKSYCLRRTAYTLTALILLYCGCTVKKRRSSGSDIKAVVKETTPPVRILIKNPLVTNLDTCPKVIKGIVPPPLQTSAGAENKEPEKSHASSGKFLPPSVAKTGFYIHLKNYNTDQGLALSTVNSGIKDRLGNLWFGTYGGGVSRFDGKTFTNFTTDNGLPSNYLYSICEDKRGNLWFGFEEGGLLFYNGVKFINYTRSNGLPDDGIVVQKITSDGKLWVGTEKGVCYCELNVGQDEKLIFKTPAALRPVRNLVNCIAEDKHGNIWFGTQNDGIFFYNHKSLICYKTSQGLLSNKVGSLFCDKDDRIWVGTSKGLNCFTGKYFSTFENVSAIPNCMVNTIFQDNAGNMWFGTEGGGIGFLNYRESFSNKPIFINYTKTQGLSGNSIKIIFQDNNNNIWIGYDGDGVDCFPGCRTETDNQSHQNCIPVCTSFATPDGPLSGVVQSVIQDQNGNLWFSSEGLGLCKYNGNTITIYNKRQGLTNSAFDCMANGANGAIWIGAPGAILNFNPDNSDKTGTEFKLLNSKQGVPAHDIYYIFNDTKGNVWLCTYGGGVSKLTEKSITTYTTGQGLASNLVMGAAEDNNGNIWFCTYGGGVSKYDGTSFTNYTTQQGLANNRVNRVLKDSCGNLWFCTYGGGVSRFDGKTFLTFNKADGLSDNMVMQIVSNKTGKIFFGTNKGISVLTGFQLPAIPKEPQLPQTLPASNNMPDSELKRYNPVFEVYNEQNGYPIKDIYYTQNCLFLDNKDILWASNGDAKMGLVRFDYKDLKKDTTRPEIVIQQIKINDKKVCWYTLQSEFKNRTSDTGLSSSGDSELLARQELMTYNKVLSHSEQDTLAKKFEGVKFDSITPFYPLPTGLVLPFRDNRITFEFAAIEPAKAELVKYRYMLQGYDLSWCPVTDKTEASFGNIGEGTYTFMLQAQSPDGVWSNPVSYTFSVLPPWYRTWWAYCLYALSALSILFLLFRWRTAALRIEKIHLEQKVRERTAEVMKQKELVDEKNKDILASINYAKRLQDAILPPVSIIKKYFPESFILYEPKDIVAGDFYWMEREGDKLFLAACDCTGHGVPGAMVSVVCSNALNRAVKEYRITDPGKILDKVRELVIETFSQRDASGEKFGVNIQDGMDISLLAISRNPEDKTNQLQWAGAYNPLWYIESGLKDANALKELTADKQPIGKTDKPKPFKTHTFQIQHLGSGGASLYLFTDGYADQFGGPKGKKFKYKQMEELLIMNADKSMADQKNILEQKLKEWKGNLEQVDDILIIGIRI